MRFIKLDNAPTARLGLLASVKRKNDHGARYHRRLFRQRE